MSASLTTRRLGFTLLLAILIAGSVGLIDGDAAALIFLPSWLGLFFAWPYISRKFGFNFPKAPAPRPPRRPTPRGRLFVTAFLAFGLSYVVALAIDPALFGPCLLFLWVTLYYAWPLLTTRLPYFGFEKTISTVPVPAPKRPLWLRTVRSTLGGVAFVFIIVLIPTLILVPLSISFARARKVHNSIHDGMTVAEVIHTAHDCDLFSASSDFPNDKTDVKDIPAVRLDRTKDGIYRTFDSATSRDLNLSESAAIDHLHARLHDGYAWHFHYTYINATPQHITFIVDFGPDGRVSQVGPVYGWD
jgi:hypothetical protein